MKDQQDTDLESGRRPGERSRLRRFRLFMPSRLLIALIATFVTGLGFYAIRRGCTLDVKIAKDGVSLHVAPPRQLPDH